MNLYFQNAVFNEGMNTTVRRGLQWKNQTGKEVTIRETGNKEPLGRVIIKSVIVKPVFEIEDRDVEYEHDPQCRTREGIIRELERIYPKLQHDDMLSIINFDFIIV